MIPLLPILDLVGKALDKILPDPQARAEAKLKLIELSQQGGLKELEASTQTILAEMSGSWLQRNWRPLSMLTFLVLICADSFGLLEFRLSNEAWIVFKIGLGGYVVGRSAEKIVTTWKQ